MTTLEKYSDDTYVFSPDLTNKNESMLDETQKLHRKRAEAIINQVDAESNRKKNITNRTLSKLVINVIAHHYPNPFLFEEEREEAISDFGDMALYIINYFIKLRHEPNGKPCLYKSLEPVHIKEIIFAYYDVFHFLPDKGMNGIAMVMSKGNDDPNERFSPLDPIIGTLASTLLSTSYKTENMSSSCKQDPRTVEHITSPKEESALMKEASPFANGVYIPEVYKETGRLLTYREAYEKHNLYFTTCFAANYLGPDAKPPIMPDNWNPLDWEKETYGTTPERDSQFWAVILSILRPFDSHYDKAYFFQDDGCGRTGKGTTTRLLRSMVGEGNYANLALKHLDGKGSNFVLEILTNLGIYLIIYDENDPKTDYLEDAANFKCLCTGDPVYVDRKYKTPVSVTFRGRIVECINGRIGSKDNTPSLMRRIALMTFSHKIGRGNITENKDIKGRWMQDQKVIDWFATEAINRDIRAFPETEETEESLHDMDRQNNHVLRFIEDYLSRMIQNWFTLTDIYPAFCEFCKNEHIQAVKKTTFESEAARILARPESEWAYVPRKGYPDKVGTVKIGQYNVPLDKLAGEVIVYIPVKGREEVVPYDKRREWWINTLLATDPIFDLLMYSACEGSKNARKSDNFKNSLDAVTHLYHTTDCSQGKRAYFRKPDAELDTLTKIGHDLLLTPDEMKDEMSPSDILKLLSSSMRYSDKNSEEAKAFDYRDSDKDYFEKFNTKKRVLCYRPFNSSSNSGYKELNDYVIKRLKQLGI